jgi:hypothetical protein
MPETRRMPGHRQVHLSHSTVKHQLANARSKVGARTTAELVWILAPRLPELGGPAESDEQRSPEGVGRATARPHDRISIPGRDVGSRPCRKSTKRGLMSSGDRMSGRWPPATATARIAPGMVAATASPVSSGPGMVGPCARRRGDGRGRDVGRCAGPVVAAVLATGSEKAAAHRLGLSHSTV